MSNRAINNTAKRSQRINDLEREIRINRDRITSMGVRVRDIAEDIEVVSSVTEDCDAQRREEIAELTTTVGAHRFMTLAVIGRTLDATSWNPWTRYKARKALREMIR